MSYITKSNRNIVVVFSILTVMVVGTLAPNFASIAYASHFDFGDSLKQSIKQSQSNDQDSNVVSGGNTDDSGNNINFQFQGNTGNNVGAQS